jgi:hypothetical protein
LPAYLDFVFIFGNYTRKLTIFSSKSADTTSEDPKASSKEKISKAKQQSEKKSVTVYSKTTTAAQKATTAEEFSFQSLIQPNFHLLSLEIFSLNILVLII